MNPATVILILVLVLVLFGLPLWPHAAYVGAWPGGVATVLLIVVLVLLLGGRR